MQFVLQVIYLSGQSSQIHELVPAAPHLPLHLVVLSSRCTNRHFLLRMQNRMRDTLCTRSTEFSQEFRVVHLSSRDIVDLEASFFGDFPENQDAYMFHQVVEGRVRNS